MAWVFSKKIAKRFGLERDVSNMNIKTSRRNALKVGTLAALSFGAYRSFAGPNDGSVSLRQSTLLSDAFEDGKYVLPKLPYDYNALEPLYEQRTLKIHHQKHHAGYVKGLNRTLEKLSQANQTRDYSSIKALSRALAFHGSGHILHCLFWQSMKPGGSKVPDELSDAMKRDFGSVSAARMQFAAAAKAVEASGWAIFAYEPIGGKLLVLQAEKHQNLSIWGVVPLMVCDVWEHAYYLQYANDRGAWVDNFMKLANWEFAQKRLSSARSKV